MAFQELLTSIYAVASFKLTDGMFALWLRALKPYSLEEVRGAIDIFMADPANAGIGVLPAHIIKIIHAGKNATIARCWNCQTDITATGWTALGSGRVCNPCYKAYLNNEWTSGRAA